MFSTSLDLLGVQASTDITLGVTEAHKATHHSKVNPLDEINTDKHNDLTQ